MDPDSKLGTVAKLAPILLAALIVVGAILLVGLNRLDGKDLIALVGTAISLAGAGRMMTFPSAMTSTKETDPTTGKIIETKTQQPLGMPPPQPPANGPTQPPPTVLPSPPTPTGGTT